MHRCSKTQCWETRKVRPYHQCCSYISSVIFFIFQIETLFCRRHTAEHLLKYIKASHSLSPLLLSLAIYLLISLSLSLRQKTFNESSSGWPQPPSAPHQSPQDPQRPQEKADWAKINLHFLPKNTTSRPTYLLDLTYTFHDVE